MYIQWNAIQLQRKLKSGKRVDLENIILSQATLTQKDKNLCILLHRQILVSNYTACNVEV